MRFVLAVGALLTAHAADATVINGKQDYLTASGNSHYSTGPAAQIAYANLYDSATLDHQGGSISYLYLHNGSAASVAATTSWLYAYDASTVSLDAGANVSWLYGFGTSRITATGGSGSYGYFDDDASATLTGYDLSHLGARGSSDVTFSGKFTSAYVSPDAQLTLDLGQSGMTGWDPGATGYVSLLGTGRATIRAYNLAFSGNLLSGALANGSTFLLDLRSYGCAEQYLCNPDSTQIKDMANLHLVDLGTGPTPPAGVPEPKSWLMMIVGFGLAGIGLRTARGTKAATLA
jgi:hypothetical protein